jgi:hypothetical protein
MLPPFGTIEILKGNLVLRQVPFFRIYGPSGSNLARECDLLPLIGQPGSQCKNLPRSE